MIVFRADANRKIGEGHVVRCIAIAKQLRRLGKEVLFVTADASPARLLAGEGLMHITLNTDWMCMDEETKVLVAVLKKSHTKCMLVDSYYATPEYFERLSGITRLLCMDDFGLNVYPVDTVINYNAYAYAIDYVRMYDGMSTKLLLGPKYAPLREEFSTASHKPITARIHDIMITTGSTDPFHVSDGIVQRMAGDRFFDGVRLHIVAGRYYTNMDALVHLSQTYPQVIVHRNMSDIWSLMATCDAAVSAGGTTVYELCACGVPSVIFGFVDNQMTMRRFLGSAGAMIDCGDVRELKDECLDNIVKGIKALADAEKRAALREKARRITDGRGAARLAAYISEATAYDGGKTV